MSADSKRILLPTVNVKFSMEMSFYWQVRLAFMSLLTIGLGKASYYKRISFSCFFACNSSFFYICSFFFSNLVNGAIMIFVLISISFIIYTLSNPY